MAVDAFRRCTLVTGPANSGKSRWAETLAQRSGLHVCYLATGPTMPEDPDWQQKLERHRRRRPNSWTNREVGLELPEAISACSPGQLALVDSLGTWVAAGLDSGRSDWDQHCLALVEAIQRAPGPLILVGEEAGWGVVPATKIGGLFRERLGALLQQLMPCCDAAWLVLHGRALDLLAQSEPVPQD